MDELNIFTISFVLKTSDFCQYLMKIVMIKNRIDTEINVEKAASGVKVKAFNAPLTKIREWMDSA